MFKLNESSKCYFSKLYFKLMYHIAFSQTCFNQIKFNEAFLIAVSLFVKILNKLCIRKAATEISF